MTTTQLPLEAVQLVQAIRESQVAIEQWQAQLDALKQQLLDLHAAGAVPTTFESQGIKASLTRRRTTVYDDYAKEEIKTLQALLTEAGHSSVKESDPFWSFRAVK